MKSTSARIVVQATASDKDAIVSKARRLKLPVSELMRRGAFAYNPSEDDDAPGALADAARMSAKRSCAAIDDVLDFIAASNRRIEVMKVKASRKRRR